MIDPSVARITYVVPALTRLGLYSADAEKLLMGTAAVESNFRNFVQFGGGPARGMFQMELTTFNDVTGRVLAGKKHHALRDAAYGMADTSPPSFLSLTTNHLFAAAMARVKYYSVPTSIPSGLENQADYWWVHYNGRSPHGLKPADYIKSWNSFCSALYS